ncbi:hypothetical protein ACIPX0_11735 [Streptomyces sp. NPDC090075]|uniref:hypothetical protein n=1 Tax=Streptomyces sp. NPDC090075 TaxID=3365937 RepID=UPI0038243142
MNRRRSFNRGWAVKPKPNIWAQLTDPGAASQPVTLPHDALIGRPRTPEGSGRTAYFPPSGEYEYSKTFHVPESWLRDAGVDAEDVCFPGQIHGFMNHMFPAAADAFEQIGIWVRRRCDATDSRLP